MTWSRGRGLPSPSGLPPPPAPATTSISTASGLRVISPPLPAPTLISPGRLSHRLLAQGVPRNAPSLSNQQHKFPSESTTSNGVEGWLVPLGVGWLFLRLCAFALYFVPTFIAFRRGHRNRWIIFLINLVFGVTVLGWIGALIWAVNKIDVATAAFLAFLLPVSEKRNTGGLHQGRGKLPNCGGRVNGETHCGRKLYRCRECLWLCCSNRDCTNYGWTGGSNLGVCPRCGNIGMDS